MIGLIQWLRFLWGRGAPYSDPIPKTTRPADTVGKLSDYLWYLLPKFLKRKPRDESNVGAHVEAWGYVLDLVRTMLKDVILQLHPTTATGTFLKRLGRFRGTLPLPLEDDGDYRPRVLDAFEDRQAGGTLPGFVADLADIGFDVRIWEYWVLDRDLFSPPESPTERDRYIVPGPIALTWDDGGLLDEGGTFDDWGSPDGAWTDHEHRLVMWLDDEWVFVDPPEGMIAKVLDQDRPSKR